MTKTPLSFVVTSVWNRVLCFLLSVASFYFARQYFDPGYDPHHLHFRAFSRFMDNLYIEFGRWPPTLISIAFGVGLMWLAIKPRREKP